MTTFNVANSTALKSALASAKSGDTILMAAGNYGTFAFNNLKYAGYVTVRSADASKPATFANIDVYNSTYLRIDKVKVSDPTNGASGSKVVDISNGSHHIEFLNSDVHGKVDGVYSGHYGIYAGSVSDILIQGNYVHDVKNGLVNIGVTNLKEIGNRVNFIGEDSFKFAGIKNGLVQNNTGAGNVYPGEGAHLDFMQFQGSSSALVIKGNMLLANNVANIQGIFLNDGTYNDVTIENNIVYTGMGNAVYVSAGSGAKVRYNTLLNPMGEIHKDSQIRLLSGGIVENNITGGATAKTSGSNVTISYNPSSGAYYYNKNYVNAMEGRGLTIDDLRPIAGSVAASKGAFARINELLKIGSAPAPTDPAPAPSPMPDPDDSGTLFSRPGDLEFAGTASGVIQVAPPPALKVPAATVAFSFDADTVSGMRGLVSKDATGPGHHFTSYIENGALKVRFQNETTEKIFTVSGIQANREYDVTASFGDGKVAAWLDGNSIGSASFVTNWTKNVEYLQIGANGWASASGQPGFTGIYDGTISDVTIVGGFKTPTQMAVASGTSTLAMSAPTLTASAAPTAASSDLDPVFSRLGALEFTGETGDIVNIPHQEALEIDQGAIAFSFEADRVDLRQGLVSKDATGYAGGGNHFSALVQNGALEVLFQDTDSNAVLRLPGIKANTEYDVLATFDDKTVMLWVDGKLIGSHALDMDWSENGQWMQIGGLGWGSASGASTASNPFDGTISNVAIFDQAIAPADLGWL